MPARAVFLPGILFLFFAFLLLLLVSVSLPALPTLDVVRCHFTGSAAPHVSTDAESTKGDQNRAYCIYGSQTGHRTCVDPGYGYSVQLLSAASNVTIGVGATRGLAVHPVATGVTFIALLFSLSSHVTMALFASFLSVIAALLTLIALAIDVGLYVIVHNSVHRLNDVQALSIAAPGSVEFPFPLSWYG
ncbi:hypothetical protein F5148DRAFT_1207473 [Russula earlei]|uniref:Uncharacterized protein n=1 Tax=Russula earlei TaxID=71964 RepID=A0ACC0U802_9AGAM|nr:hypothetical protein F5148DRAFT_1207473 [Russula earlei]